ncbi:PucR family transcriptional regulator [Mycolicibacterium moriokaense]|nr:PucR family transcriptional regulator [Mycolicibacterium moriokaense]
MITVADVVADDTLNLQVVAGSERLDREVTSAHVSELTSPGDWLRGGELLMTVGLLLPMNPAGCEDYLAECARAGVAAVALGLGHGLPYQDCPEPLRIAAQRCELPLLTVPDETPFIAVTKWVFDVIASQEHSELQAAMEINKTLTAVATRSAALPALLSAWSATSDTPCVVCDGAAQLIAATPDTPASVVESAVAAAAAASTTGADWSMHGEFEVHAVGARVASAYIALGAAMDTRTRASSTVLVALVALDIERRNLSGRAERQRRSQIFAQMLRPGIRPERARQLAAGIGLAAKQFQVAVVDADGADPAEALVLRLEASLPDALVLLRGDVVEVAHPDLTVLTETLKTHAGGLRTGIGASVGVDSFALSAMQARSLLPVSARLGRIVTASEGETVSLLLSLGSAEAVRGFSDAVLAPLDQLDPKERLELLRTLEQWLSVNGAWDPAAARLSLHRNTVRNRIERIARLTGRRMDDGDDRMGLWLALKARAALP